VPTHPHPELEYISYIGHCISNESAPRKCM
jgi:hypothetical protein